MRSQDEIRKSVTQSILQALKGDLLPWRQQFIDDSNSPGLHTSLSTSKPYLGINQIILMAAAASVKSRYKSKWWGTFNQIRHLNASVRKGEKSHKIILWKPIKRSRVNQQGKEIDDTFLIMREFSIFNAEQTTALEQFRVGYSKPQDTVVERYKECDDLIDSTGAEIEYGGNQPCYRTGDDVIELPFRHQFESAEAFYETAFHELLHKERANRTKGKYAFEELVAEIGACLLMSHFNLPTAATMPNSCAYIQGWLTGLQNDSKFIFSAAAQASNVVASLLAGSKQEAEVEEEPVPF